MTNKQSNKKDKKSATFFWNFATKKNKTWHSFSIKLKLCLTSIMLTITQFQSDFFSIEKKKKNIKLDLVSHFLNILSTTENLNETKVTSDVNTPLPK